MSRRRWLAAPAIGLALVLTACSPTSSRTGDRTPTTTTGTPTTGAPATAPPGAVPELPDLDEEVAAATREDPPTPAIDELLRTAPGLTATTDAETCARGQDGLASVAATVVAEVATVTDGVLGELVLGLLADLRDHLRRCAGGPPDADLRARIELRLTLIGERQADLGA